jgi:Peptidase A4 family
VKPVRSTLAALALGAASLTVATPAPAMAVQGSANIPAPAVLSASAYSALGAYGGRTLIQAKVSTAVVSCRLKLLSRQSFKVSYATNARYCHVNFYAYVTVAANPTPVYRSVAFEVIGLNAEGQFSRGLVYLNVAPKGSNYHAPPPPVVNTDPPSPPAPPIVRKANPPAPPAEPASYSGPVQNFSPNWSGYEALGSGFTFVTGTFNVPTLDNDETCQTFESQWVGIDGDTAIPGGSNLIQAGVTEDPYDDYSDCNAPGTFYVRAWWEVLPEYQTEQDISNYYLTVHAGDTITVSITRYGTNDMWSIEVEDRTDNQVAGQDVYYDGPGNSAEWVNESATSPQECSGAVNELANECPETEYSPAVNFGSLGYNATDVTGTKLDTMYQNGSDVSTPTWQPNLAALLRNGFSTSYTGY